MKQAKKKHKLTGGTIQYFSSCIMRVSKKEKENYPRDKREVNLFQNQLEPDHEKN